MMTDVPLVTVIACCYNHERYVIECLDAIRDQTYPNIQLIIMDDCSHDNSVPLIREWMITVNYDCIFVAHKTNQGLCMTLNEALVLAKGKYISIISTDDIWMPDFIAQYVNVFENGSDDIGVVYGSSSEIDEFGNYIQGKGCLFGEKPVGTVYLELLKTNFLMANAVLIRRDCFDNVGTYDETLYFEDYDMWLRIARVYKFAYFPKILAIKRRHSASMSNTNRHEIMKSLSLVYLKQLESGYDIGDYKKILNEKLTKYCETLYQINHPKASKYLWMRYHKRKWKRDFLMWLLCVFGIQFNDYERILFFLTKISTKL